MAANENALTRPIVELGICSLHKNGVEFNQDRNVYQLRGPYGNFTHNAGTFRNLFHIGRF